MNTDQITAAHSRLANLAKTQGWTPPETVIDADGGPSQGLLAFCKSHGVSLDWALLGKTPYLLTGTRSQITRGEAQATAQVIQSLLGAVMGMDLAKDGNHAFEVISIAYDKAKSLNQALDSVNCGELN